MFVDLVQKTRSIRRFKPSSAPTMQQLEEFIALARLAPSAGNRQPLKYGLVKDPKRLEEVFSCLTWAGYLPDWPGPSSEERPTGYIVICADPTISKAPQIDLGLAAQIILLAAQSQGLGGCLLAAIDRPRLHQLLSLPADLEILLVAALGVPAERVKLTTVGEDDNIRYWRDSSQIHYVPKRKLEELIITKY